jgi:hypothetical protein
LPKKSSRWAGGVGGTNAAPRNSISSAAGGVRTAHCTALCVCDCKKLDEQSFNGQPQPAPQLACRLHLLVQLPRLRRSTPMTGALVGIGIAATVTVTVTTTVTAG